MNFRNMIWTILVCFIFLVTNIKAADIPPSPPARLAGYVYLNGQLLKDSNGYSLRIEISEDRNRGENRLSGPLFSPYLK
ncbi:MAG: hypothetical protein ABID54_04250 [Pseudomonadota bacterium]